MLGYILIGGIALFGFFALRGSSSHAGATPTPRLPPSPLPSTGPTPTNPIVAAGQTANDWLTVLASSSGYPAIDQELSASAAALIEAYNATHGCPGLDVLSVRRFQQAVNTAITVRGLPAPLHADGAYDEPTDAFLLLIGQVHYPSCIYTFVQESAPVTAETAGSNYAMVQSTNPHFRPY